ncbi:GGDEF domain-containing protein [Brumicola nitratireducens]|uniref:diguanylate cyclase n=1 Tax=Glaciecola nitratireducens (strain JCM 12485 / KCTC 12276 / FR1064) TaxID=1085623 RepID=G4QN02_GLANF|nr:GGDEF domain-containing protein [Glaciecola nitratireducens]AEP31421.1 two-component response regulator [Glaciecola nitratireducens FR1064]
MLIDDGSLVSSVLNAFQDHICIMDIQGNILFVNNAWVDFERNNSSNDLTDWLSVNYLDVCDKSIGDGSQFAEKAGHGIRAVINKKAPFFKIEYPCHSPNMQRWFVLFCTAFEFENSRLILVKHSNVTQKIKAQINSHTDALTLVGNRRALDEFLDHEWRRCSRLRQPISALMIDIDDFKQFNDINGHLKGDDCLKKISQALKNLVHRPSDIFCRYGGEEFIYILGNTNLHIALELSDKIHSSIEDLHIIQNQELPDKYVTVSIGVCSICPTSSEEKEILLKKADHCLYQAKSGGKNTTRSSD